MNTTRIPIHTCSCGAVNDAASGHTTTPQAGHVSVCAECGILTIFNEDMTQRPPTVEEFADLQADPIWRQIEAVQDVILERGRIRR